ncbi:putative bifunctional diguanylate cyclase/phosphodiesterase [Undibacterium sp. WLHG33]|uniref:putative bifunctional diguanylate cyclase/phosphodiesterase n=1 Tax=Undibacterium sp. WLHG33 TaxID=3412482 RepID=UPI003C30CC1A
MMKTSADLVNLSLGVTLGEAVLSLDESALDNEINRIAHTLFSDGAVTYERGHVTSGMSEQGFRISVSPETYYLLAARQGIYSEADLEKMNALAALTARLFAKRQHLLQQQDLNLQQQMLQMQILDQIHESVITMDLAGFILSWNRGAEKLFGYRSDEVLGKNILFLYDDEESDDGMSAFFDHFLEHGGREMEVRRRKKSGEVFWASLTLSPLINPDNQPVGIVGYLSDITQRKEAEKKINRLAYFDTLTQLPNRSLFKQLVDQSLQQLRRKQTSGALLFIDLNRFKPVNDTFGRQVGDALLTQVARRIQQTLRNEDMIARLGSDEFAVALTDVNQYYHASLVAQKILSALDAAFDIGIHELRVSASIGISLFPEDGMDADSLLQRADIAMFKAKRNSAGISGSYAFYSQDMDAHIAGKLFLESGLRKALDQQEFFLVYQPKIDVRSRTLVSVEVLLRWQHPERGLISPVEFISIAEESGLILQIDAWVLNSACRQAKSWQDTGLTPFRIAVNLSAKEFTSALPSKIEALLRQHQISPAWLELEITESMLMNSTESVIAIMEQLVALGVSLALDDFGTGYSSLSYLKRFPISSIKIDRSFVQGIPADASDCAIASAIIVMAHQLQLKVVAEGVETPEQYQFLSAASCDEVQGFLFSRPTSPQEITNLITKVF